MPAMGAAARNARNGGFVCVSGGATVSHPIRSLGFEGSRARERWHGAAWHYFTGVALQLYTQEMRPRRKKK